MSVIEPSNSPKQFACLIGNGLSIAYNPKLTMEALTDGLLERLLELAGEAAADALLGFAQELNSAGELHFETLLSPLDHVARALPSLVGAAPLVPEHSGALIQTAKALAGIHRVGMATVLELISQRAFGEGQDCLDPVVKRVCRAIYDLPTEEGIAVGTLSYDALIHAGFLDLPNVVDLVPGYVPLVQYEVADGVPLAGRRLRRTADFRRTDRIKILNMHGSLSWLWNLDVKDAVKFEMQGLRTAAYWEYLRQGKAHRVPVVVLTDQKKAAIQDWPFSLAYGMFEKDLSWSSHWLVAGYAFEDEPLNAVLRDAAATRVRLDRATDLLVIDYGKDPDDWKGRVANAIGLGTESFRVDMTGLPDAVDGGEWLAWKASE